MAVATTLDATSPRTRDPAETMTALQRHAAFFDPDGTGVVTLGQTWAGLGRLGVSLIYRLVLPPIINGFLGYLTQRKPSFRIVVAKIADGKHPFDTGSFADDGTIDESALAQVVALAGTDAGAGAAVTEKEMRALILARGNRRPAMGKVAGALGSWFSAREVRLLFCLAADTTKREGGRDVPAVTPRTLRRLYDGTLFHLLARRRRAKRLET
jgi:peroxygenase